jgi:hypothetical protein
MPEIAPPTMVAVKALMVAVPAVNVPVNEGDAVSAFVATAVAMLLNSVSISVPLTILAALPDAKESFDAKSVLFV